MGRRLSDHEYVAFLNDVNVDRLNLPPWGGVIQWEGMEVLVFCAGRAPVEGGWFSSTDPGPCTDIRLTDITDIRPMVEAIPSWKYNPHDNTAVWHLPEETKNRIEELLQEAGAAIHPLSPQNLIIVLALIAGIMVFKELKSPS
jgi:hypothetical protein